MSRRYALVLLLGAVVVLQPLAGLDCSPGGPQRLPCCDEPAAGCHQIGSAAACCPDAPAPSESSTMAAARPTSRPHDVPVIVATHGAVPAPPVFAGGFAAFTRSTVDPPPRPPAVLRL